MTFPLFTTLLDVAQSYDGFLCDAFGVFWNGTSIYPGALETFEALNSRGSRVVILSNSTQPGLKECEKYGRHGLLQGKHYHRLITSGDVAKDMFTRGIFPFATPQKKYWVLGGVHPKYGAPHLKMFEDTPFQVTDDLAQADFIYIGIPHLDGDDQTDPECFRSQVQSLVSSERLMVCANPDCFAQEGSPMRFVVRQGCLAMMYEQMGGKVFYIGKPHINVYEVALKEFPSQDFRRILMIGDNIDTDIRGARRAGLDSALILGTGIACLQIQAKGLEIFQSAIDKAHMPTHWVQFFAQNPEDSGK